MSAAKRIIYFSEGSEKDQITFFFFFFEKGYLFNFFNSEKNGSEGNLFYLCIYNVLKD